MNGLRILLLDDDPLLRQSVSDLLDTLGHRVTACGTIEEAYAALAGPARYQLALVDLDLGKSRVDGVAIISKLRLARAALPPVIVISGQPVEVIRMAAKVANAQTYLHKPCSLAQLQTAIDVALGPAPNER